MYKALVLEDEERAMRVLLHQLKAHKELQIVAACENIDSAREAIYRHRPDILFLDIRVQGQAVFPLVDELWRKGLTPSIVFVTAWGETHLKEATASCEQLFQWSYLTKPVKDEKMARLIERFVEVQSRAGGHSPADARPGRLRIRSGRRELLIYFNDIVYCESDGNYVNVFSLQDKKLMKQIWPGSLKTLLMEELSAERFVRISSKRAINTDYLKGSADNRATCELQAEDLPDTIRLRVPENRRRVVWARLLGEG